MALKEEHKALVQRCEEQRNAAALAVQQVLVLTEEKRQLQLGHDRLAIELTDARASSETFSVDRARELDQMNTTVCIISFYLHSVAYSSTHRSLAWRTL